jgi:hypothetical protein
MPKNLINANRNLTHDVAHAFGKPQAQREAYRQACAMRRNRNRIERLEQDRWILDREFSSINEAKQYVRIHSLRTYTV